VNAPVASLGNADWLTKGPLPWLLSTLHRDGEEARAVGGAVRNTLIGEAVTEIDVATTAPPDEAKRRLEAAGFRTVPTGIAHGTITAILDGHSFEVTTLRRDVETFGRHATVAFGRDWKADAERRDFTMNALSATADGSVYDYVGGFPDLVARRVRFIGDPAQRIAEDYLRILRFFRFHASYGRGGFDADGLHACIEGRAGLAQLSRERIRMELMKLLLARNAVDAVTVMADAGLLITVLGGVPDLGGFARMTGIEQGASHDPVRRLGALAVRIAEDAVRLWQRLRLANAEHDRLAYMAMEWWRVAPGDDKAARVLLYRLGPERFTDRIMLAWARSRAAADDPAWRALADLPKRWTAPTFPIKADDLMQRGVAKGPALGAALRAAEDTWLAADFPDDRAAVASIADAVAKT